MKKRVFLKILVAITVLTSILLSSLLGVSKAEYFKELSSSTLSLEAEPDLSFRYYLYDCDSIDAPSGAYSGEWGVYPTSKTFKQRIIVGQKGNGSTASGAVNEYNESTSKWETSADNRNSYLGDNLIYQIQIPVDETGYYTLHFTVDFIRYLHNDELVDTSSNKDKTNHPNGRWSEEDENFYSQSYDRAIGCEVLNASDGFSYGRYKNGSSGETNKLDLYGRINNKVYTKTTKSEEENQNIRLLSADSLYQWKTMTPSKQETVNLSFKVEPEDVTRGYVLWSWDFSGLAGPREYEMQFIDVAFKKIMDIPDSTTGLLDTDQPYFMFPQTSIVNNQLVLSPKGDFVDYHDYFINDDGTTSKIRGMNSRGKMSYSRGRGSFVTEATTNSLSLQAESIMCGYNESGTSDSTKYLNKVADDTYGNALSFRVPLKNVQYNKTYKVTFDFSIARQGTYDINATTHDADVLNRAHRTQAVHADYADFNKLLLDIDHWSTADKYQNVFMSYLYSGSANDQICRSTYDHNTTGLQQIDYNDKSYQNKPLTRYDEVASEASVNAAQDAYTKSKDSSIYADLSKTTATSINDTFCITKINGNAKQVTRNGFNAIQHTEYEGQSVINWLTFYNTTFSFNIKQDQAGVDLNDLYWVWAIDAVLPQSYYRIRIDNVRIQEVVQYASEINRDGLYISDTRIKLADHADHYDDSTDNSSSYKGAFSGFRGQNGTGQNYLAKTYMLNELVTGTNKIFQSQSNIYAPIIDASKFKVTNHQIKLDGEVACIGGVNKYVFSIDGGVTWEDATFTGGNATLTSTLSGGVNQYTVGTTRYESSEFSGVGMTFANATHLHKNDGNQFKAEDMVNGGFGGGKLVVDLSKYKNQANLDVIIAAVPASNTDLRCEIIRIVNYNAMRNYFSVVKNVVSDIQVTVGSKTSPLNAYYNITTDSSAAGNYTVNEYENTESFSYMKGFRLSNSKTSNQIASYSRGTLCSYDYEEVRAAYVNVPVYTTVSITGFAIVEGGISSFSWSVDGGRTWNPCDGTTGAAVYDTLSTASSSTDFDTPLARAQAWMDPDITKAQVKNMVKSYDGNTTKNKFGTYLKADLTDYVGKTVDIIFGAKPTDSDVYCSVARVDNVAVYGNNTSATYITSVTIGGTTVDPTYNGLDKKPLNRVSKGDANSGTPQWNLGITDMNEARFAYTIFETYTPNIYQFRAYNNLENAVNGGATIKICGNTYSKSELSNVYEYTLDGGKTWTKITHASSAHAKDDGNWASLKTATDNTLSNTNGGYNDTGLVITLPTDISNEVRTLLIRSKTADGYIPVFCIRLKFN